ncbi:MAG: efflux RND transporter periplasmic adaptor subunit [Candidatus Eremiobacteraeota bacterium]|nr:efflux RND transporter periplasmic adaptor subunit [Candidatus Eremiobacteraeota bacterium]
MTRSARTALVVVVLLAVVATLWFALARRNAATPQGGPQPQVPLATVTEGTVDRSIALTGRVGSPAGTQAKLAFAVAGTVAGIDVRLGEHVEAAAPLARLDATAYTLAAAQAAAEARAATGGAALAGIDRVSTKLRVDAAELARRQRLYRAGIVALRDVQAAQAMMAADRADAQSARAQLAQAQAQARAASFHAASTNYDVARTTLRAPAAGTVVGIFVQPGETVDSTTPAIALASERQGLATLDVPVPDLARIRPGDPVHLRSSAGRFEGRVAGVATAVDPATGLAVVSVAGIPDGIAAGTPVDATVVTGDVRGLVIPLGALIEDPQTGAQLVFVRELDRNGAGRFDVRKVTIDFRDAQRVRVTSGLRPGERVAAQGAIDLLAQPSR